jgi:hypothetical protein
MDTILVVNAGSSSLKFQVFGVSNLTCLLKGHIDGVGVRPRPRAEGADKATLIDETYPRETIPLGKDNESPLGATQMLRDVAEVTVAFRTRPRVLRPPQPKGRV